MSWRDPFEILGIARTGDTTDIRRAYARKLKVTNPEDDAEAFQALRAAYEHALAMAPHIGADDEEDEDAGYGDDGLLPDTAWSAPAETSPEPEPAYQLETAFESEPEPALPWGAPRPPADHVSRDEIDDLNAAIARFTQMLQADVVDRDAARHTLRAILALPALDAMDVRDQVEHNIGLIVLNAGRDAGFMLDVAIETFDWDSERLRARSPIGQAVLERREGRAFMMRLKNASDLVGAWAALSKRPEERALRNRATPGLPRQVRQVLQVVDQQHPWLEEELHPRALAWWRRYLATPQFGPMSIWTVIVLPLLLMLIVGSVWPIGDNPLVSLAVAYLLSLVGVSAALGGGFGLLRLQARWRRVRGYAATIAEKLGWAPATLIGLVGAATTPAGIDWAFAALAGLAAGWAVVTAEDGDGPDAVDLVWAFPAAIIPIWQIPISMPRWLHRVLGLFVLLILWMFVVRPIAPNAAWAPVFVALAGAGAAFVMGHFTLEHAWRRTALPVRTVVLSSGAATVGLTPMWLWSTSPNAALAPLGLAVIAIVVLLERIVSLSEPPSRLRGVLYGWGWVPGVMFADVALNEIRHGGAPVLGAGLWLLSAAAAGLVVALRRERIIRAQAYA